MAQNPFFLLLSEWICLLFAQKQSDPKGQGIVDTPPPVCVSVTFFTGDHFFSTLGGMRHFVSHTSHNHLQGGSVAKMGHHTLEAVWQKWVATLLAKYTISQCKATVSSLNEGGGKHFSVTNCAPEKQGVAILTLLIKDHLGIKFTWKRKRLFVAATAMMFSCKKYR